MPGRYGAGPSLAWLLRQAEQRFGGESRFRRTRRCVMDIS